MTLFFFLILIIFFRFFRLERIPNFFGNIFITTAKNHLMDDLSSISYIFTFIFCSSTIAKFVYILKISSYYWTHYIGKGILIHFMESRNEALSKLLYSFAIFVLKLFQESFSITRNNQRNHTIVGFLCFQCFLSFLYCWEDLSKLLFPKISFL